MITSPISITALEPGDRLRWPWRNITIKGTVERTHPETGRVDLVDDEGMRWRMQIELLRPLLDEEAPR